MSNYNSHAMREFRAAGWVDDRGKYCDEMQKAICEHVLKLLEVFDGEGEDIERGINFYPLSDKGSFGFTVRTKKYVYWFRWRKKLKSFSFTHSHVCDEHKRD